MTLAHYNGVTFEAVAWAPHEAEVDLSFACMFEHEANGAQLGGGLLSLDQSLDRLLTRSRAAGTFKARALETLPIRFPPSAVRARSLMVIGLGDPDTLCEKRVEAASSLALSQALRWEARTVAFAPNLLDAGLAIKPDLYVSRAMLQGVLAAIDVERALLATRSSAPLSVTTWSFDTGPSRLAGAVLEFRAAFEQLTGLQAAF
ncbi:MAG: M17 family peptidase N-terminal domain-containing protein [Caldimonas sp.]